MGLPTSSKSETKALIAIPMTKGLSESIQIEYVRRYCEEVNNATSAQSFRSVLHRKLSRYTEMVFSSRLTSVYTVLYAFYPIV